MKIQEKIRSVIRDIPNFPKEGILFKDITPLLQDPELMKELIEYWAQELEGLKIDKIAAIESRGFLFGVPLAIAMQKPFVPIRKKGKLPYDCVSMSYALEYGKAEIEMHIDAIKAGERVLVVDDLLATGGTAAAAARLIEHQQAVVCGFSFLIDLTFLGGANLLVSHSDDLKSIISY